MTWISRLGGLYTFGRFSYPLLSARTRLHVYFYAAILVYIYTYITLHEHVQAKSMYWKDLPVLCTADMGKMKKKIFTSCDTAFFCIWKFFHMYNFGSWETTANVNTFSCIAIFFFSLKKTLKFVMSSV